MLREACLIVPSTGPKAKETLKVVGEWMVQAFGGVTMTTGIGGWRDPNGNSVVEPVSIFTTACDPDNPHVASILHGMANYVRVEMVQDAVYTRRPNGEVVIVDASTADPSHKPWKRISIDPPASPRDWKPGNPSGAAHDPAVDVEGFPRGAASLPALESEDRL